MKKGLIVLNSYRDLNQNKYKVDRFKEEFSKFSIGLDVLKSTQLNIVLKDGKVSIPSIDGYAFCIYLDKDEIVARLIENKIPLFNSASALIKCNDKMKTYMELIGSGIKTPKTIPSRICYRENEYETSKNKEYLDNIEKELSFPLICKCNYGSLGLQVFLISNRKELEKTYDKLKLQPHFYQEFISSSRGKDYRIITINHKVQAYMLRVNKNDFRSNIALGGEGILTPPPSSFIETAEKISRILDLDYAGIDILLGENNTPILSEVNSNAFFNEIEAVSKVNITEKLVEHIMSKIQLD